MPDRPVPTQKPSDSVPGGGARPPGSPPERGADARGGSGLSRAELEAVRRRDPSALARLFDLYFDRVFGLVYRLMGERSAAEDVTQEVFFKVHRAAQQIDPARDPLPWLLTIAHNACRDVWRSNAHRLQRQSASIDEHPALAASLPSRAADPEGELLARERERRVQDAIVRLPETLRVAIVLHDYQGLGHEEIAAIAKIGHAAARKRYSRALAALAKLLEEGAR